MNRFCKLLLLHLLAISQLTTGQTIVRSSLSCLGSTITDNGLILRQTMGQPSSTDVLRMGGIQLRQGFQQPVAAMNLVRDARQVDFSLSPNPASENTLLRFKEEISRCTIYIRNANGILLYKYSQDILYEKWLDLSDIRPGIYIVTVICENGHDSKKLIIAN